VPFQAFVKDFPSLLNILTTTKRESMISKKRPFVPSKAEDIRIGDVIKFSRPGGKISKGMVKYIGPLPDRNDVYFGLELESEGELHFYSF